MYMPPKSGQVNFLWSNDDVRMVTEHISPKLGQVNFIPPVTNFWLRLCRLGAGMTRMSNENLLSYKYESETRRTVSVKRGRKFPPQFFLILRIFQVTQHTCTNEIY